jgi:Tfp pilus assembly protein PilF
VESRATWQALQERLTNAHAAVEAGERARALAEITAALDIDPHFLAAHSLRDRILATDPARPAQAAPDASAAPPARRQPRLH